MRSVKDHRHIYTYRALLALNLRTATDNRRVVTLLLDDMTGVSAEPRDDFVVPASEPLWDRPVPGSGVRNDCHRWLNTPPAREDAPVGALPVDDPLLPSELNLEARWSRCHECIMPG